MHLHEMCAGLPLASPLQVEESLATFQSALALMPDFPDCLSNMGNALKMTVRWSDCVT